jgi:tetratricopeptide (TPR) repeat protein
MMVLRALALGGLVVFGSYQFSSYYKANDEAKNASILISRGRCEEGVSVLERLQREKALMPEYNETLSDAYLQMAMQYAKIGNYNRAVELLRKVPAKAKASTQAQHFLRRWTPRVRN